ncbi:acyltransferase [Streptomyces sp. SID3343]|uniref:acyltransferase family protein n=1 Tax=Streptomyces sp. SID3343 TaxID=2690260 RepID=UPI00136D9968|nr:acyltransferase [Streptomyces sp. SID3343]MYW02170.1 acyltransferase family protein [Streptomyces sp. SID3343]
MSLSPAVLAEGQPPPAEEAPKPETAHRTRRARRGGGTRLYALDILRLFAALAVVSFHWTADIAVPQIWGGRIPDDFMPGVARVTSYGWLGVELFFIISGFVICMSSWGRPVGDFFVSRIVRLYPAYWAGIALTATVLLLVSDLGRPGARTGIDWRTIAGNLTMFQGPLDLKHVDGVYWTLWMELQFYLLFAIVVAKGLTYRRVVAFCGLWMIAIMFVPAAKIPMLTQLVMAEQAPYFIAGVAMYLMHRFGPNMLLWGIVGFTWIVAVTNAKHLKSIYDEATGHTLSTTGVSLGITLCYAVIIAVALGYFGWVRWSGLTVFGALTYPLYLIHQEAGWTMLHWLHNRGLNPGAALGVALASALLVAYLIHRLVERTLGGVLKRGLAKSLKTLRLETSRALEATGSADKGAPPR